MSLPRLPRRRTLGWILLAGAAGYALAWLVTSLAILAMSQTARSAERGHRPAEAMPGVKNFTRVDARVWRGGAPSADGYRGLRERGVRTVVDLRAEVLSPETLAVPVGQGLTVVRIPVRDGQPPTAAQVERFLATVRAARAPVFVHCGAGVGRTGSMSAAYLVGTGQADAATATSRSLAVGPPSLEQIAFMRGLRDGQVSRVPAGLTMISRVADSPRRAWARR